MTLDLERIQKDLKGSIRLKSIRDREAVSEIKRRMGMYSTCVREPGFFTISISEVEDRPTRDKLRRLLILQKGLVAARFGRHVGRRK